MKKLLVLLALVIAAGFTGCEDTNKPSAGKDTYATVITFNANGGTAGSMTTQEIPENTSANLKTNTFTRTGGYTFGGWATSASGAKVYDDGQSYTAAAGNQTVTLYAVWTSPSGSSVVSFNNAGGSGGQTANVTATAGQAMPALSVAAPTYEGNTGEYPAGYYNTLLCNNTTTPGALYNVSYPNDAEKFYEKKWFNGYWDAQTGGNKYYNADLSSAKNWDKTESSITLYAQWLTVEQWLKAERQSATDIVLGNDDFIAYFVDTPPTIDGNGSDPAWAKAKWQPIKYQWMYQNPLSPATNAEDFSGRFKAVWTADRLYILAEIIDDTISVSRNVEFGTGYTDAHNDDCLEFFIDEDASGGLRESAGNGNNFFTYHLGYRDGNHFAADYVGGSANNSTDLALRIQNGIILRNVHLNYVINKNRTTNTDTWETEMKVYNNTYPLRETPGMPSSNNPTAAPTNPERTPVTLTGGKKMGLAVAYCDSDGTSSSNTRNHFFGSMIVVGNSEGSANDSRNRSYLDSTGYAKIYLVK